MMTTPAGGWKSIRIGVEVAVVPLPESETVSGLLLPEWAIVSVPVSGPAVVGRKLTVKLAEAPAARVVGVGELTRKAAWSVVMLLMAMLALPLAPEWVSVRLCGAEVVLTAWLPKPNADDETLSRVE